MTPGAFIGNQVSYVTEIGTVFEADRSEITVAWPWHGGGVNLTLNGETYKLSFVRPKGGTDFDKSDAENRSKGSAGWDCHWQHMLDVSISRIIVAFTETIGLWALSLLN